MLPGGAEVYSNHTNFSANQTAALQNRAGDHRGDQHSAAETFGGPPSRAATLSTHLRSDSKANSKYKVKISTTNPVAQTLDISIDSNRVLRKKRALPPSQPLRNRSASGNSRSKEPRDRSSKTVGRGGLSVKSDRRCTPIQVTRDANSTRKALQRIYTADWSRRNTKKEAKSQKKRNADSASTTSARNVVVIPKFTGCRQGGINSSFQVKFKNEQIEEDPLRFKKIGISKINSAAAIGIDPLHVNDLKKNDKGLKQQRQESARIKMEVPEMMEAIQQSSMFNGRLADLTIHSDVKSPNLFFEQGRIPLSVYKKRD